MGESNSAGMRYKTFSSLNIAHHTKELNPSKHYCSSRIHSILLYCSPSFYTMLSPTKIKLTKIAHAASKIIHSPTPQHFRSIWCLTTMTPTTSSIHTSHCCHPVADTNHWIGEGCTLAESLFLLQLQYQIYIYTLHRSIMYVNDNMMTFVVMYMYALMWLSDCENELNGASFYSSIYINIPSTDGHT